MGYNKIQKKTVREDGKKAFTTRVSMEILDELDRICREYGFTKSGFIERSLRYTIKNIKNDSIICLD